VIRIGVSGQPWTGTHKEVKWKGLWHDEKETTSSIQGVPTLNKLWHKKGNFGGHPPPPTTTKENILKHSFTLSVFWLNFRHLNFTFSTFRAEYYIKIKNSQFIYIHIYIYIYIYTFICSLRNTYNFGTASDGDASQMLSVLTALLCL